MAPNDPKTLKNMLKHVFEPFGVVLDGFGLILGDLKIFDLEQFRGDLTAGYTGDFT